MKQYYLLRKESDPKVVGVKDGITQVEIKKSGFSNPSAYDDLIAFFDTFKYWNKESFVPTRYFNIEYVEVLKGAKLTDFIGYRPNLMACPFIVSAKVKSILEEHIVQEHYFFPVKMYKDGELVSDSYFLLYCPYLDFEIVDFSKSTFYVGNKVFGKKIVQVNNKEEYLSFLEQQPLLQREAIMLNNKFDNTLHFFVPRVSGGIYASERLAKRIVDEKLTGIKVVTDTVCVSNN